MDARTWTDEYFQRLLPHEPDVYRYFLKFIDDEIGPEAVVVDLGCGSEGICLHLQGRVKEIIGVDRDLRSIPYENRVEADIDRRIPLEDGCADLAVAKFLLEHLKRPEFFFLEIFRILKPKGSLVLLTSNILYYPYTFNYLLSKVLPDHYRKKVVSILTGKEIGEIHTTYYRCNTPGTVLRTARANSFQVEFLKTFSDYRSTSFNRFFGRLAVWYEFLVNRMGADRMKGFILLKARKPEVEA